jgi:hypothetical protein
MGSQRKLRPKLRVMLSEGLAKLNKPSEICGANGLKRKMSLLLSGNVESRLSLFIVPTLRAHRYACLLHVCPHPDGEYMPQSSV